MPETVVPATPSRFAFASPPLRLSSLSESLSSLSSLSLSFLGAGFAFVTTATASGQNCDVEGLTLILSALGSFSRMFPTNASYSSCPKEMGKRQIGHRQCLQ